MKKFLLALAFVTMLGARPVAADTPYDFEIWHVDGSVLPIPTTCNSLQYEESAELVGSNADPCVTIENSEIGPGAIIDSLIVCGPDQTDMPESTEIEYYVSGYAEFYATDGSMTGHVMEDGSGFYELWDYSEEPLAQCETVDASGAYSNTYTKNTDDLRVSVSTEAYESGCAEESYHTLTLCVGMLEEESDDLLDPSNWGLPSEPLIPLPFTAMTQTVEINIDADTMWSIGRIALTAYNIVSGGNDSLWALFAIVLLLPTVGMILYKLLTKPPDI